MMPAKDELQVFAGAVMTGAAGKITTLTILLAPHVLVPAVPATIVPHGSANT